MEALQLARPVSHNHILFTRLIFLRLWKQRVRLFVDIARRFDSRVVCRNKGGAREGSETNIK